jgi:hypothetical protein
MKEKRKKKMMTIANNDPAIFFNESDEFIYAHDIISTHYSTTAIVVPMPKKIHTIGNQDQQLALQIIHTCIIFFWEDYSPDELKTIN